MAALFNSNVVQSNMTKLTPRVCIIQFDQKRKSTALGKNPSHCFVQCIRTTKGTLNQVPIFSSLSSSTACS